jgi:hypothetical protein
VGQREEKKRDVARGESDRIGVQELQAAVHATHGGHDVREGFPRVCARGHRREFHVRMVQQQFDENFARVTGRADDTDFHRRRRIKRHDAIIEAEFPRKAITRAKIKSPHREGAGFFKKRRRGRRLIRTRRSS